MAWANGCIHGERISDMLVRELSAAPAALRWLAGPLCVEWWCAVCMSDERREIREIFLQFSSIFFILCQMSFYDFMILIAMNKSNEVTLGQYSLSH